MVWDGARGRCGGRGCRGERLQEERLVKGKTTWETPAPETPDRNGPERPDVQSGTAGDDRTQTERALQTGCVFTLTGFH